MSLSKEKEIHEKIVSFTIYRTPPETIIIIEKLLCFLVYWTHNRVRCTLGSSFCQRTILATNQPKSQPMHLYGKFDSDILYFINVIGIWFQKDGVKGTSWLFAVLFSLHIQRTQIIIKINFPSFASVFI